MRQVVPLGKAQGLQGHQGSHPGGQNGSDMGLLDHLGQQKEDIHLAGIGHVEGSWVVVAADAAGLAGRPLDEAEAEAETAVLQ
jgi:hypothetical protein